MPNPNETQGENVTASWKADRTEKPAASRTATPASSESSVNNAELVSKVKESLSKYFGDDDDAPADEVADDKEVKEEKEEAVEEDDNEEPEAKEDDSKEDEDEAAAEEESEDDSEAPTLPDSYRRSLKAAGYDDAKIEKDLKKFGLDFVEYASRVHAARNAEISRYADAGRRARQQQQGTPDDQQFGGLDFQPVKPLDVKALKEEYGEDALIAQATEPVNAAIAKVNALMPAMKQVMEQMQQSQLSVLNNQIETFFNRPALKPYAEVFGQSGKVPTQQQIDSRNKVLEMADALVVGTRLQGRDLTINEALEDAFNSVSHEFKVETTRKTLKKELKQRSKGITLRPGSKNKAVPGAAPKNREELVGRTNSRLKAVFGR